MVTEAGKVRDQGPSARDLRPEMLEWPPGGYFGRHNGEGVEHLCVASANCARWKSAANRLISSQASAITAYSPSRGRTADTSTLRRLERARKGPRGGTSDAAPDADTERASPAPAGAGRRAAAPPTP